MTEAPRDEVERPHITLGPDEVAEAVANLDEARRAAIDLAARLAEAEGALEAVRSLLEGCETQYRSLLAEFRTAEGALADAEATIEAMHDEFIAAARTEVENEDLRGALAKVRAGLDAWEAMTDSYGKQRMIRDLRRRAALGPEATT